MYSKCQLQKLIYKLLKLHLKLIESVGQAGTNLRSDAKQPVLWTFNFAKPLFLANLFRMKI